MPGIVQNVLTEVLTFWRKGLQTPAHLLGSGASMGLYTRMYSNCAASLLSTTGFAPLLRRQHTVTPNASASVLHLSLWDSEHF